MRKSLITAAIAINLLGSGTIITLINNHVVHAEATLTKKSVTVNNNYKASQLKYQQSVKIYHINQKKLNSIGYTVVNNQNQAKFKATHVKKINGVKYIYTSLFKGSWIRQSDWNNFKTNLTKFKQAYQKYHAQKESTATESTQASSSSTASSASSANSNSQASTTDVTQSQTAQSILNDSSFKTTYRATALAEINKLRASVGVEPVTEDPTLDKIADIRIAQNIARGDGTISHYDSSGNALNVSAAAQLGLTEPLSENIAMRTLYDITDAKGIAYTITHQYIDEGPENNDGKEHGHYENLVSPYVKTIGISFGITTTPDSKGYIYMYDAEELSASSSYDINNNIVNNLNQQTSN